MSYYIRKDTKIVCTAIAVAIYTDRVVRKEELKESEKLIRRIFDEDEKKLQDEVITNVSKKIEKYKKDINLYYKDEKYLNENTEYSEIYSELMEKIFNSDLQMHDSERKKIR